MMDWFTALAEGLEGMPFLQGLVAAVCTFILEDPTTVGSGLLVADGKMYYWAALIGLSLGIGIGDFGLYLAGRLAQGRLKSWTLVSEARLESAGAWFDRNMIYAVLAARFLPGMRLPTYVAAGVLKVSPWKFLAVAMGASIIWTIVLLNLSILIGETILVHVGALKWPLGLGFVALLAVVQITAARRQRKNESTPAELQEEDEPVTSFFEFWPPFLFYIPVSIHYLCLAVKHRGLMLPTVSNPSIYSGGLLMESKSQILNLVPPEQRRWVAPWAVYTRPEASTPLNRVCEEACAAMEAAGLSFPIVAKPDVGQRGFGVRPVHNQDELSAYLAEFPTGVKVVLQKLIPYSEEAGVFYYRKPDEEEGKIISITLKHFPYVIGDGQRTLKRLILDDPRARVTRKVFFKRHQDRLDSIIEEGQKYPLVFAGDHSQGAVFRNGTDQATPELLRRVHEIASSMPEFYFGRFDIRCRSIEALKQGEELKVVEINGASSEATHIWDVRTTLVDAYSALFHQFRILFEIGALNRKRGFRTLSPFQLIRDVIKYKKQKRHYPLAH